MKKDSVKIAFLLAIPLIAASVSLPAVASEADAGLILVQLDSTGASVSAESGPEIDHVVGNPEEGETIQVVDGAGVKAIVTVQYGLSESTAARLAPTETSEDPAVMPDPEVKTIDGNVFWSGNFGDSVERTAEMGANPEFASAVTSTTASFDWIEPKDGKYAVLRNGSVIGSSTDGRFADADLQPGETYDYLFETATNEAGFGTSRTVTVHTPELAASRSGGSIQPLAYQRYTTAYDYKTFIPNDKVNNLAAQLGCGIASDEAFRGDNREFASPGVGAPYDTPSYRTQMFFNVNWDNSAPYDLAYVKSVGPTRRLSWYNSVIETRYASDSGMVFQNPTRSGDLVTFGVSHEVGDPFCAAGAIRYSLSTVKIYRSGTVSIVGSRQPVPSHEAYARFSSTDGSETWKALYQATGPNFNCLLPVICASENINKSVSG